MLTVHHLGISQSERIVWLCEELSIPYELKSYDRDPVTRLAPAEYKALHPFGTAPVITDGTVVLSESGAVMEYIIARHGKGRLAVRPDAPNYADYLFWFHFANGSMMPVQFAGAIKPSPDETPRTRISRERCERTWKMVESPARRGALLRRPGVHRRRHHHAVPADDHARVRAARHLGLPERPRVSATYRRASRVSASDAERRSADDAAADLRRCAEPTSSASSRA